MFCFSVLGRGRSSIQFFGELVLRTLVWLLKVLGPCSISVNPSVLSKFLQFQTNPEKIRSLRLTLSKWNKNQWLSREKLLKQTHSGRERKKLSSLPFAPISVACLGQCRSQEVRGCSPGLGVPVGKQLFLSVAIGEPACIKYLCCFICSCTCTQIIWRIQGTW